MLEIKIEKDGIKLTNSTFLPFGSSENEDPEVARMRLAQRRYDILGSFSKRLIASIQRRMKACEDKLMNHIKDVKFVSEYGLICWETKSGIRDHFCEPSYVAMQNAIKYLEKGDWKSFLINQACLDQTLKALLNDPEQDHSDVNGCKYSELVSLLMEGHMFN